MQRLMAICGALNITITDINFSKSYLQMQQLGQKRLGDTALAVNPDDARYKELLVKSKGTFC